MVSTCLDAEPAARAHGDRTSVTQCGEVAAAHLERDGYAVETQEIVAARPDRRVIVGAGEAGLGIATRFGAGFMTSMDNRNRPEGWDRDSVLLSDTAFGHVGAGGSIGFCDPAERLSVGYAMNRMGEGILLNERGQGLVDAVYRSLGYRSDRSGAWRR